MAEPIRIAVVGAGLVGKRHVTAIGETPGAVMNAIVDPEAAHQAYAHELGATWCDELAVLLRDHRPDGVILATPTPLHIDQALEVVRHGVPVLVEKPIGTTASEAEKLVETAESLGVPVLVGHHRRYNPIIHRAKLALSRGDIGDIRSVHMNCWFYKPDSYFDAAPWRKEPGAGPILVNLVHDIDLLRYLCGEIISVQAQSAPSKRGYQNEDLAAAVVRFASGAIGTVSVSDSVVSPWSWETTSREYPIYPPTDQSCYVFGGSEGALSVPDMRLWTPSGDVPHWWEPLQVAHLSPETADPLCNQIAHFVDVIRGQKPLVSGREGLRTLQVIEAIQKACATGETVHLPP